MAYAGRFLRVHLTDGSWTAESIDEALARKAFLGSGYAAHLFAVEADPRWDPLDPESPLYIFNGLLTGTMAPAASRTSFCGRSPLTGIWNESNMGGFWGAALRRAGWDGIVVTGRARQPVYLWVTEAGVEVRPAGHLWGLDHYETVRRIREELGRDAEVACIGPAGENRVRFAAIMSGGEAHSRAAGRGGMGAVMGSKLLKAIAVDGGQRPAYADPQGMRQAVRAANAHIRPATLSMRQYGTAGGFLGAEAHGDLPLRNWRDGSWPQAERIAGQTIRERVGVRSVPCHACPISCSQIVRYDGREVHGPEYETLAGFGGMLLNDSLGTMLAVNDLCNRLGLDTISTSAVLAFAVEAAERGLLAAEGLGWGMDPRPWVERIARREGVGDLLAEGVRRAAARLGPGAEAFAVHVKGMEVPYHDPRAFFAMAVTYATASRGACHLESLAYWNGYGLLFPDLPPADQPHDRFDPEAAVPVAIAFQDYFATYNPLGLCKFLGKASVGPTRVAEWIRAATGWAISPEEVVERGRAFFTFKRRINEGLGITRADDRLPPRLLEPRPDGGAAGRVPPLARMLERYYRLRGWTA